MGGLILAQESSVLNTLFNGDRQVAHGNALFCKLSCDPSMPVKPT